ncbi:MAG: SPASM domain-containing protein [Verrucomicrobia bacterium]|nr:SPASM domain-containing protein [Verrucomicrobiota bacterium]
MIKNWLVINPLVVSAFQKLRKTRSYRNLIVSIVKRYAAEIKQSKQYNIGIETTNICNAACVFCPYTIMKRKKKVMDDDTFNCVVERIKEAGSEPYGFSIAGTGEPLVDKKIFARIQRLKKEFPSTLMKFHSNFGLVSEEAIDGVIANLDEINISFNGYRKDVYEQTMKLDYERTLKNVQRLIEKRRAAGSRLKIRISMALVANNEGGERAFLDKWGKQVDSIAINRAHDYSGVVENTAGTNRFDYDVPPLPCRALWNGLTIGSDGELLLCCLDYEGNHNLGNLRENKLLDLFYSEKFEHLRQIHLSGELERFPVCKRCAVPYDHGAHWFIKRFI